MDNFTQLVSSVTWCYVTHGCVFNFFDQQLHAPVPIDYGLSFTNSALVIDVNFSSGAPRLLGTYKVVPVPIKVLGEQALVQISDFIRYSEK